MERFLLKHLEEWLDNNNRKPLLIYGARQVGKTTLVRDIFANKYFNNSYIYIDFKINTEDRIFIKNHVNAKDIINYLSLKYDMAINEKTLIIFDEIQECVPCLTSLKYFEQDFKKIPIIATGSMVRIKLKQVEYKNNAIKFDGEIEKENQDGNNNYMFPTGKIEKLYMYPLSFEEYLFSRNNAFFEYLKDSYNNKKQLDTNYHTMAMNYFYEFMAIGGMPEVVDSFLKTSSFINARNILSTLYSDYLNDMVLYQISQETIMKTRNIFLNAYKQLNKENKNFKISVIEQGKRNRDYFYPFEWLKAGRICYISHQLKEKITLPLKEDGEGLYRVYLSDVGFFALQSGIRGEKFVDDNRDITLSGIFFENYVATALGTRNIPLFYWKGKTTSELEFVLNLDNAIVPIDAKKNRRELSSLENYRLHNKKQLAIKVSGNMYGYNEERELLTLPYYYLDFFLDENENKIQKELI